MKKPDAHKIEQYQAEVKKKYIMADYFTIYIK